jgi:hypothetical protein
LFGGLFYTICFRSWPELNSPSPPEADFIEGWAALLAGVEKKIFINKTKILHPVSLLCKHSRNPPLNEGNLRG